MHSQIKPTLWYITEKQQQLRSGVTVIVIVIIFIIIIMTIDCAPSRRNEHEFQTLTNIHALNAPNTNTDDVDWLAQSGKILLKVYVKYEIQNLENDFILSTSYKRYDSS